METTNPISNTPLPIKVAAPEREMSIIASAAHKRKKRSTYCFANAMLFKSFFDLVIQQNQELELPYNFLHGVGEYTFYIKIVDALKWLCENLDEEKKTPYLLLRATHTISRERMGIVMRRKVGAPVVNISTLIRTPSGSVQPSITSISEHTAQGTVDGRSNEIQQDLIQPSWKDAITEWINTEGNEGNVKTFQFDKITLEDKEWVANVCAGTNIEYIFKDNELKMVKPI